MGTGAPELLAFRRGYYDLLVSLLWREPPAPLLEELGAGIAERAAGARGLHPALGAGWDALAAALAAGPAAAVAEAAQDEYTALFVGPGVPRLHLYESYYLTGRLLDRPLAELRAFLRGIGLERAERSAEPEDWLAFELDVMRRLLAREAAAPATETGPRRAQADFLAGHLLVWGPTAGRDLAAAPEARLYRGVGLLLEGFLALERDLVREWGGTEVGSLEAARRRFAGTGEWRGPRFDLADSPPSGDPPRIRP